MMLNFFCFPCFGTSACPFSRFNNHRSEFFPAFQVLYKPPIWVVCNAKIFLLPLFLKEYLYVSLFLVLVILHKSILLLFYKELCKTPWKIPSILSIPKEYVKWEHWEKGEELLIGFNKRGNLKIREVE